MTVAYRLYPNKEQKIFLHNNMDGFRFVYHRMLTNRITLNLNRSYHHFFHDASVCYPKFKQKISHQKGSVDIEMNNKIAYIK